MLRRDDIKTLTHTTQRRLQKLKEQRAAKGLDTPAHILTEIEDLEVELADLELKLVALEELPRHNPYQGLAAFREADASVFFGRERFTAELVDNVRNKPLVMVLGPSGSGKSSIVFAGLIPKLIQEEDFWLISSFRPGPEPFRALATTLLPYLEPQMTETDRLVESRKLTSVLRSGGLHLTDVVSRLLEKNTDVSRLLLIVDQFEELYTLCPEPETRYRFLDALLTGVAGERELTSSLPPSNFSSRLCLVLTLRADFMSQALAYRSFAEALRDADIKLGPMTSAELRQAIEQPAARQGVSFEAGLVERILGDISDEPGNLPLLEFALTEQWLHQERGVLTHTAYETVGKVEGALSRYAEQVFARLSQAEQEQARWIFIQMVQPGVGTEDTRRLASREEVGDPQWPLVQRLADKRLVITDQIPDGPETLEMVHEALIRGWSRLQEWMQVDRTFRAWQERLRFALGQWQDTEQDEGTLLRGAPLAEAENWLVKRSEDLNQAERMFIQASVELRDREAAEREAQRERELELERQRAEEQAESARRLQQRATYLIVALLLAIGAGIVAVIFANRANNAAITAQQQRRTALAQSLAALAPRTNNDNELTTLLGIEAFYLNQEISGNINWLIDDTLREVLSNTHFNVTLSGHASPVKFAAFSPDGQWLASGSDDGTIHLWNIADPTAEVQVLSGHSGTVWAAAFSPDGRWLASASTDRTIRLWDLNSPLFEAQILNGHSDRVLTIAFSPDGRWLASGSDDQTVRLWDRRDLAAGTQILGKHDAFVRSLAFSPDGRWIASGSGDETIRLWDLNDLTVQVKIIRGSQASVSSVAFSPDGQWLASGGPDQAVRLWNMNDLEGETVVLEGHENWVWSVAFSPDGQWLASGGADQTIRLWNMNDLEEEAVVLEGHENWVWSVAFSLDGRWLASASDDRTVRLWTMSNSTGVVHLSDHYQEKISAVAFSSDEAWLASGGEDGNVRLWNLDDPEAGSRIFNDYDSWIRSVAFNRESDQLAVGGDDETVEVWDLNEPEGKAVLLKGHKGTVWSVAFSPNGQWLASGSDDQTVRLWNLSNPAEAQTLVEYSSTVWSVAFSPDGHWLASGHDDGTVQLWDLSKPTGETVILSGHNESVLSVAFSPDGQWLASGGGDGITRLWDLSDSMPEARLLKGRASFIRSLAFSPDGQWLASGNGNQTVWLWDLDNPEAEAIVLAGHQDWVTSVAFGPNGRWLASGSDDGTVRLWRWRLEDLVEIGCQKVQRNLSMAEWERYLPGEEYHRTCHMPPSGPGAPSDVPVGFE